MPLLHFICLVYGGLYAGIAIALLFVLPMSELNMGNLIPDGSIGIIACFYGGYNLFKNV